MNPTYFRIDLTRQLRDATNLMFVLALPVAMYLLFGTQSGADESAGNGNVAFYVLGSLAYYGAATGMVAVTGIAAAENMLGWGRTVALTKQPRWAYIVNKAGVALTMALIALLLVHIVGWFTGARTDTPGVWLATIGISLVCLLPWAVFGLAAALLFRSETAVGVASGLLTFFAFFGNVFMPLSGTMLDIARFTPMYGMAGLVRWPLTEGNLATGGKDEMWVLLVNTGVWTLLFCLLALLGASRSTARR